MATAAQRAQKRDLEPHWRDKLADSVRRFVRRSVGALLVAVSVGLALALVTYSSVDPSLSTAAAGPPANWLGPVGAYSSDFLLLLFGPAAALFLPLLLFAGLRLLRGAEGGRLGWRCRSRWPVCCCSGSRRRYSPEARCPACPPAGAE